MAERSISGKDVLLFIDPTGGTTYSLVVCLTDNTYDRTTAQADAATKCGPGSAAGAQTINITFTGQIVYEAAAGRLSEDALDDLWTSSAIFGWRISTLAMSTGDVIYAGQGILFDLKADYAMGQATVTGTIGVQGTPAKSYGTGSI